MKKIYVVMSRGYEPRPIMAFNRCADALSAAQSILECEAFEAAEHVKCIPAVITLDGFNDVADDEPSECE